MMSPFYLVLLLVCALAVGVLFRPPRDLKEPIASLLPTEALRAGASIALCATLLLVGGYLWLVLAYLCVGVLLIAAHAMAKQVTTRSRAAKMWFNVRFFGNRAAEELPEDGAAVPSHDLGADLGEAPSESPEAEEIDLEAPSKHVMYHRPVAPEKRD